MFRKHFRLIPVLLTIIIVIESTYILNTQLDKLSSFFFKEPLRNNRVVTQSSNGESAKDGVINISYLNYLQTLKRSVIASVNAVLVCRGTIEEIYSKPWVDNFIHKYQFELGFKLKNSPYDCKYLRYDKLSLPSLQYYQLVNGKKTIIKFSDFKVGDKIIARTELDLMKPIDMRNTSKLIKTTIIRVQSY